MFDLTPKICISEKDFLEKYGLEKTVLDEIRLKLLEKHNHKCQGCSAPRESNKLSIHIVEENPGNPLESEFAILCKACHATQHIDKSVENEWVQLVNSIYSQNELINICRAKNGSLATSIANRKISLLKKKPAQFIEELKAGTLGKNSIKVVFSPKKFTWD